MTLLSSVVGRLSPGVDFVVDEHGRNVELTDAGLATVERALGRGSLHESGDDLRLSQVNCALHARALLRRGVDYLVRDGRIEMIDEMTGPSRAGSPLARGPAVGARCEGGAGAAARKGR